METFNNNFPRVLINFLIQHLNNILHRNNYFELQKPINPVQPTHTNTPVQKRHRLHCDNFPPIVRVVKPERRLNVNCPSPVG